MALSPINSWQKEAEKMEVVTDFLFLSSKITADDDYSHEIQRHLILGINDMTKLDSILKSRNITLLTKVYIVKAVVFPVVMNGCENWTIKKAEQKRIDNLNCGVGQESQEPLAQQEDQTSQSQRKSTLNIHLKDWCWNSNTLAPDMKRWLIGKDSDAREDWGQEEKEVTEDEIVGWHHWLDGHESEQTLGESEGQGAWCTAAHRVAKSWTRLRDWTKDRHYLFDPSITEKVKLKFPALLLNFIKMLLYSAITFVCVIVFQHCCGVHACVEFFYIFSGNWTFHYETFVFLYL